MGVVVGAHAQADNYPNKPIKTVVAYPPGGAADKLARPISERLSAALGQTSSWITSLAVVQRSVPITRPSNPLTATPYTSRIRVLSRLFRACESSGMTA